MTLTSAETLAHRFYRASVTFTYSYFYYIYYITVSLTPTR